MHMYDIYVNITNAYGYRMYEYLLWNGVYTTHRHTPKDWKKETNGSEATLTAREFGVVVTRGLLVPSHLDLFYFITTGSDILSHFCRIGKNTKEGKKENGIHNITYWRILGLYCSMYE